MERPDIKQLIEDLEATPNRTREQERELLRLKLKLRRDLLITSSINNDGDALRSELLNLCHKLESFREDSDA